jgi:hypothetical protein
MDDKTNAKLIEYSEKLEWFGRGPKRPAGVGHSMCHSCKDATIGVRAWLTDDGAIDYVWWTGGTCVVARATAACIAEAINSKVLDADKPEQWKIILGETFLDLPPHPCVDAALVAFERAAWGPVGYEELVPYETDWAGVDMDWEDLKYE